MTSQTDSRFPSVRTAVLTVLLALILGAFAAAQESDLRIVVLEGADRVNIIEQGTAVCDPMRWRRWFRLPGPPGALLRPPCS